MPPAVGGAHTEVMGIRVLVVGGGVAGLATARALRLRGVESHVVERSASSNHPGTGVYLPANAVRAIGELGLAGELAARAHPISQQRFLDHRGRSLFEVDLTDFWKEAGTCVALGHADLHELLADGVPVSPGRTVTALHDEADRVVATFDDGTTGSYDAAVGADGVRSWVRSAYLSGQGPRFLRQVSWRFVAHDAPDLPGWTVWLGRRATFLAVPLGGGRTYCFAAVDRPTPDDPVTDQPEGLPHLFGTFAEPVPAMIRGHRSQPPYFSPVEEVLEQSWTRGRVVLVGDAAHAMSPNMAEGVGMAVEDGLVLAGTIAAGLPLTEFEARRRPRVEDVRAQTHRRDRARNLPSFVRDPMLRRLGPRIFRGNYQRLLSTP
jgi:2-polyprenyl-6-methoxyphenol hydroxylase-like FAD-dependent oxidoreductase